MDYYSLPLELEREYCPAAIF